MNVSPTTRTRNTAATRVTALRSRSHLVVPVLKTARRATRRTNPIDTSVTAIALALTSQAVSITALAVGAIDLSAVAASTARSLAITRRSAIAEAHLTPIRALRRLQALLRALAGQARPHLPAALRPRAHLVAHHPRVRQARPHLPAALRPRAHLAGLARRALHRRAALALRPRLLAGVPRLRVLGALAAPRLHGAPLALRPRAVNYF